MNAITLNDRARTLLLGSTLEVIDELLRTDAITLAELRLALLNAFRRIEQLEQDAL
jgi:hypothetical protein